MESDAGLQSLEENAEVAPSLVTPPQEETPPPADPPPQNTADEEPEPEGTIEIPQGKVVPLGAVQAERGKRKEAEKALQAKEAELAEAREKAKRFDEAKDYLDKARPYIEKAKADLERQNRPQEPRVDQEAIDYAKNFDLYTTDGEPDVDRARKIIQFHDDRAAKQAQQTVAPILQTEAQRQSTALYQKYLATPEVNGYKIDAKYLAEAWNNVPIEISADPRVAQVLFTNALGRQILEGSKPVQAPPPALPTESIGSTKPPSDALTGQSRAFMRASNMKEKEYESIRNEYKPGQSNSLE